MKISALVADVSRRFLKQPHSLFPALTSSLSSVGLTLRPPQLGLRLLVVARILDLFAIAQSRQVPQANVKASGFGGLRQRRSLALNRKADVPLASFALDGFDRAFNRTMQFGLAPPLNLEFAVREQSAAVAVAWKRHAVKAVTRLEARESSLALFLFHPTKEGFEILVHAAQDILTAREVLKLKIISGANLPQLIGLAVVVQRLTGEAVGSAPFLQRAIVESAGFRQLAGQELNLLLRRIESVIEGLSHNVRSITMQGCWLICTDASIYRINCAPALDALGA